MQIFSIISAALSIAMVSLRLIKGTTNRVKTIVTKSKTPSHLAYQVIESNLNLYREPSLSSEVVGRVSAGEIVVSGTLIGHQADRMIWRQLEKGWAPEKMADDSIIFLNRL